jgi:hypothetical protein
MCVVAALAELTAKAEVAKMNKAAANGSAIVLNFIILLCRSRRESNRVSILFNPPLNHRGDYM